MNKDAAKGIVKELKKGANTEFALAPNDKEPLLLVGKKPFTEALVKRLATEQIGVVFSGGALYVGQINRDEGLVFLVDKEKSKGAVSPKGGKVALQRLCKAMVGVGVNAAELQGAEVRFPGDNTVVSDEPTEAGIATQLKEWEEGLDRLKHRLDQLRDHRTKDKPLPKGYKTADKLRSTIVRRARRMEQDIELVLGSAQPASSDESLRLASVQERLKKIRDRTDPLCKVWNEEVSMAPALTVPVGLGTDMQNRLTALNTRLAGGPDRTTASLLLEADEIAHLADERLQKLKGAFFRSSEKKREIAALLQLKQQAMATADALRAEDAMRLRAEEVVEAIEQGRSKKTSDGINGALIIRDEGSQVRFIAKMASLDDPFKQKEFGREVASSAVGGMLSQALGIGKMITMTTPAVVRSVPDRGGPQILGIQDAWSALGNGGATDYTFISVGGTSLKLDVAEIDRLCSLAGDPVNKDIWEDAFRKKLKEAGLAETDDNIQALLQAMIPYNRRQADFQYKPIEIDPTNAAEDMAAIAMFDIILGQRDHRTGKVDNILLVNEGGQTRLRPIDYGEALPDFSMNDALTPNFDAWSQMDAASLPMPKAMVDNLLALDTEDLVKAAQAAGEHSAKLTGAEGTRMNNEQLALLRVHTEMLKRALQAASDAGVQATPRDLSALMKKIGTDFLMDLGDVRQQNPTDWETQITPMLDTWSASKLAPWVGAIQAVGAARAALEEAVFDLVDEIIEAEADPSTFDEQQARTDLQTARQSVMTIQAIPELKRLFDEQDRVEQLSRRLDAFAVRLETLASG